MILAIALFASVQMSAMNRSVNPQLSPANKKLLEMKIKETGAYLNPKFGMLSTLSPDEIRYYQQSLNRFVNMYYDNKPYTTEDIIGAQMLNPNLSLFGSIR